MRERGDVDGVAIGVGTRDEFSRDVAARPALVLDHDLLAPHLRQPGGDDASGRVDSAARRERADDAHHLAGPALRTRGERANGRGAAERRDEVTPSQLITRHQLSPRDAGQLTGKSYETKTSKIQGGPSALLLPLRRFAGGMAALVKVNYRVRTDETPASGTTYCY